LAGVFSQPVDPCVNINVGTWTLPNLNRWTNSSNYVVQPDTHTIDISNDGSELFPLGFRAGQFYEDNQPPFCINVQNVAKKKIELLVETFRPQDRVCVRDVWGNSVNQNNQGAIDTCFQSQYTGCFPTLQSQQNLKLVFFCDTGCATGETSFYYRIRVSQGAWDQFDQTNSAIDTLEMWCMKIQQQGEGGSAMTQAFPSSLLSTDLPVPLAQANVLSGAASLSFPVSMITLFIMSIMTVLAMRM